MNNMRIPEQWNNMNEYELALESLTIDEFGERVYSDELINDAKQHYGEKDLKTCKSITARDIANMNLTDVQFQLQQDELAYTAYADYGRTVEPESETLFTSSLEEINQNIATDNTDINIPEELDKNSVTRSIMQSFKEKFDFFKPMSAKHGLTKNQALDKICNDYSFLETEEFKEIFDNYYKNGKKVTISLNTGSKIEISKNSILKTQNTEDSTNEPNLPLETKTMIALCVERNMQDIKMKGDEAHLKEAFKQAYELNKSLPDHKKITIYPIDKEQRLLFEKFAKELNPEQFNKLKEVEDFSIEAVQTPAKKLKM